MMSKSRKAPVHMIEAVANMVGLSQKRLRDYERMGFVKPQRQVRTNNRLYTDADIARIRHIKQLIHEHGFTLKCLQYFFASAPCWVIFKCQQRESCSAPACPSTPCFELKGAGSCPLPDDCANCPVYLNRHTEPPSLLEPR
mgnify:CR=1 FL=1